jgi:NAD(P)-dependent dehydrogenase (short-subunit alcohol dehydrogenase family)
MTIKLPDELDFIRVGRLPQKQTDQRADGKVVLITGATSGVGYAAARKFASMGAILVFLVRNNEKARNLAGELQKDFNCICRFYLADFERISELYQILIELNKKEERIDILINNAGAHRTRKRILPNGIDAIFTVNHLASFLVTRELIPLLEKSREPRIINVNSEGHRFGNVNLNDLDWKKRFYTGLRSYGASKTAQLHCMYEWKKILQPKGITINSMHPGAVKSNIGSHSGKLYNLYLKYIIGPTLKDPLISANALYYLAISTEMEGISGYFYNLTNVEKPAPHAQESDLSKTIFQKTTELIAHEID